MIVGAIDDNIQRFYTVGKAARNGWARTVHQSQIVIFFISASYSTYYILVLRDQLATRRAKKTSTIFFFLLGSVSVVW
jgi:hypothetical protein